MSEFDVLYESWLGEAMDKEKWIMFLSSKNTEALNERVMHLVAERDALRVRIEALQNYILDGQDVVARGVELMTPEQVAQWEGVAMWQVAGPLNGVEEME